jgi:hypothetical protein
VKQRACDRARYRGRHVRRHGGPASRRLQRRFRCCFRSFERQRSPIILGSQTGSQQSQTSSDVRPLPTPIDAADRLIERHQATLRDASTVPSKQRVAGSSPARRTQRSSRFGGGYLTFGSDIVVRASLVLFCGCVAGFWGAGLWRRGGLFSSCRAFQDALIADDQQCATVARCQTSPRGSQRTAKPTLATGA